MHELGGTERPALARGTSPVRKEVVGGEAGGGGGGVV